MAVQPERLSAFGDEHLVITGALSDESVGSNEAAFSEGDTIADRAVDGQEAVFADGDDS